MIARTAYSLTIFSATLAIFLSMTSATLVQENTWNSDNLDACLKKCNDNFEATLPARTVGYNPEWDAWRAANDKHLRDLNDCEAKCQNEFGNKVLFFNMDH
ncbi:hypothetical protein BGX26_012957 [Mortierella sp. AD094]|nr:hypothetical protein BGX26_012957 [Mortierella sp. AD094]